MHRITVRRIDNYGTLVDNDGKPLARQIQWSVMVDGVEVANYDSRAQARTAAAAERAALAGEVRQ